jgi:peroxiredoxin
MRFVALAMLTCLAAGCASTSTQSAPPSAVVAPTSAAAASAPPPSPTQVTVPDSLKFTATTVDGKAFDAASLAGKPAVFWFWAAWCPRCKADATALRDLQAMTEGRVNVVGVAGLKSGSEGMQKFVTDYGLVSFPQLADDKGEVWKRFEVPSQHYYVVLDPSGKVVHRGPLTIDQLRKTIGA